jgi:hypothetical protein
VCSRNKTGQEGDEGPVGPAEAGTRASWRRSTRISASLAAASIQWTRTTLNDAPDETVEEGQGHDRQASPSLLWLAKLRQGVSGPFRIALLIGVGVRWRR